MTPRGPTGGAPDIVVVADPDAAASAAAERIAAILAEAAAERGRADWATTGGSSVVGIYRNLVAARLRDAVPWPAVHVWWGDDRYVPRDHPLSNVKPLDDILLGIGLTEEGVAGAKRPGVPLAPANLHPFRTAEAIGGSRGPGWCATTLAAELAAAHLASDGGWPVFDLVLLGVGADGHVLSVFPRSPALDSRDLAMAIPAPAHIEPRVERVTLNPAILGVARHVLVVATGVGKAAILADVLGATSDPGRWPAQLARGEKATWVLDAAAAASLAS